VVIQATDGQSKLQVIGELDRFSVPLLLYEGAVYLHEGATYLVERLDWDAGIAHVRPAEVDFYTRPGIAEDVEVLTVREGSRQIANSKLQNGQSAICNLQSAIQVSWGDVRVVSRATGYRILRRTTNELLGFGQIDLPEQVLETQACWLAFPEELVERLRALGAWISDPNEYGPNWSAQRDAARVRDGFRCQGCGAAEPAGRQHDVHHRVPFRAFLADSGPRGGLPPELAWQAANRLDNLVTLCASCHRQAEASVRIRSGLGGVAALLAGIAPLHLMCDPADLGIVAEPADPRTRLPTITIYEKTPGGVGYSAQLCASMPDILQAARDLVSRCPCERGCPGCVGPVSEHEYALDTKALAAALLAQCLV
jgi:DEAD/DEAH box helicase domain-containing protein